MGKIELLMQDNQNDKALNEINKYEKKFGENKKKFSTKASFLKKPENMKRHWNIWIKV